MTRQPREPVKTALKRLLAMPAFHRLASSRRYIFCYHDVSDPGAPGHSPIYSTPTALFRKQIDALSDRVEWVSLEELLETERPRRRIATVTMDDGFASVRHEAWPHLKSRGIPLAVFACRLAIEENCLPVSTRVLLARNPALREALMAQHPPLEYDADPVGDELMLHRLSWLKAHGLFDEQLYLNAEDVRYLVAQGVTIASHSATHRGLAACDAATVDREIADNKRFLHERFHVRNPHFALPFGKKEHYAPTTLESLARNGYRFVYTTNPVDVSAGANGTVQLIPRIPLTDEDPATVLFYLNRPLLKRIDL